MYFECDGINKKVEGACSYLAPPQLTLRRPAMAAPTTSYSRGGMSCGAVIQVRCSTMFCTYSLIPVPSYSLLFITHSCVSNVLAFTYLSHIWPIHQTIEAEMAVFVKYIYGESFMRNTDLLSADG